MAVPLETVPSHPRTRALRRIRKIAEERDVGQVVLGLPRHLSGVEGKSALAVRGFADRLAGMLRDVRVTLLDERLTTRQAKERLRGRGMSEREQRSVIDQVAAAIILEHALEAEAASGKPAGEAVVSGGEQ